MTTAIDRIDRISGATGYTRAQVDLVRDTIARGASDDELMLFLALAKRSGLDPFSRQIQLIERRANVNGQWVTTRQPLTGIDGLRVIADRSGNYAPGRAPTFEYDADGALRAATSYVLKYVHGSWHEVAATAHYAEYAQMKRDGTPTGMWADKPHIMLSKCAEALALRRAFPADLSGLYTTDEFRAEPEAVAAATYTPPALPVDVATGEIVTDTRDELLADLRSAYKRALAAGVARDQLPGKAHIDGASVAELTSILATVEEMIVNTQEA